MSFTTSVTIGEQEIEVEVEYDFEAEDSSVGFAETIGIVSVLDHNGKDVWEVLSEESRDQIREDCDADRKSFEEFLQDV